MFFSLLQVISNFALGNLIFDNQITYKENTPSMNLNLRYWPKVHIERPVESLSESLSFPSQVLASLLYRSLWSIEEARYPSLFKVQIESHSFSFLECFHSHGEMRNMHI